MEEKKKKALAGAGIIGGGLVLLYFLLKKGPEPGTANLYGIVTNAQTGHAIQGIEVSFSEYSGVTGPDGYYLIEGITPGDYAVTFYDPLGRYETLVL